MSQAKSTGIAWGPTLFVVVSHIAAIAGPLIYGAYHGFTLSAIVIGAVFLFLSAFATSAGYHRLFSHGAYEAHWLFRLFLVCFGSGTFEGSVFKWAALHRRHHIASDTDEDPHDIRRGFWWAHMGWVLSKYVPTTIKSDIDDLRRDPLLRAQDRFYILFAVGFGVLFPFGLGWLCGDPWGGLVIGSFLRIVVFHHITWLINSMAHTVGSRPYSKKTSARDSVVMALLTMGEGYHNYHHTFPWDYRNGVSLASYDPTKWLIYILNWVCLTKNLIRAPKDAVAKAAANP